MLLRELTPGDDFKITGTEVQYQYEGYKNHHYTGFMHWAIKENGVKISLSHKTKVDKL